jgi:hypothetical protein
MEYIQLLIMMKAGADVDIEHAAEQGMVKESPPC